MSPIRLSCVHKGVELKGHFIHLSPSDYTVVIDSPYTGIEAGSHTPYFAMFERNRNVVDGKITEKGLRAGQSALVAAYEEADFLFRNRAALHARILAAEPGLDGLRRSAEAFRVEFLNEKKRLKALFKSGAISGTEYTSYLHAGRKRLAELDLVIEDIRISIFSGFPGFSLPYGHEKKALEFLYLTVTL